MHRNQFLTQPIYMIMKIVFLVNNFATTNEK